ncbi:hypothetical protein [Cupriavidus sp. CuC1]|uniref:hypothetical protein n=1 Tax=Cupriavidus sp. CuC1 TaxID=3373131 RepID=UPI0037D915BD
MSKNFKRAYRAEIFSPLLKIDFFNSIVGLLAAAWAVLAKPSSYENAGRIWS